MSNEAYSSREYEGLEHKFRTLFNNAVIPATPEYGVSELLRMGTLDIINSDLLPFASLEFRVTEPEDAEDYIEAYEVIVKSADNAIFSVTEIDGKYTILVDDVELVLSEQDTFEWVDHFINNVEMLIMDGKTMPDEKTANYLRAIIELPSSLRFLANRILENYNRNSIESAINDNLFNLLRIEEGKFSSDDVDITLEGGWEEAGGLKKECLSISISANNHVTITRLLGRVDTEETEIMLDEDTHIEVIDNPEEVNDILFNVYYRMHRISSDDILD